MSFKCIIFDCDGVLVDSEIIGNEILISMAKAYGLEMTIDQAMANFHGKSLKNCFQQIEEKINRKLPGNFEADFRKQSFKAFRNELKAVKGVVEFIDNLSVSYCVASSGPPEKIIQNLTATGLIDKFQNKIFSSYHINSWKPEPEIFLFAAREMGFSVDECIVIEDSIPGVMAAVRGGFRVYAYANENNAEAMEKEGAIVFRSYEELAVMLNG